MWHAQSMGRRDVAAANVYMRKATASFVFHREACPYATRLYDTRRDLWLGQRLLSLTSGSGLQRRVPQLPPAALQL